MSSAHCPPPAFCLLLLAACLVLSPAVHCQTVETPTPAPPAARRVIIPAPAPAFHGPQPILDEPRPSYPVGLRPGNTTSSHPIIVPAPAAVTAPGHHILPWPHPVNSGSSSGANSQPSASFWTTLPGFLTAAGTCIAAVAALITALRSK